MLRSCPPPAGHPPPLALAMAAALRRITVLDPEAFPSQQCLMRDDQGPAFWDLLYVQRATILDKPLRFYKQVHEDASRSGLVGDSSTGPPADANLESHRYGTTLALIAFLLVTLRDCRSADREQQIRQWLCSMCQRACHGFEGKIPICGDVVLSSTGLVSGFWGFAMRANYAFREALRNAWERLCAVGILNGALNAEAHAFEDVVMLFAFWAKCRKRAGQAHLRGQVADARDAFFTSLIGFLAGRLESYLRRVYIPAHDVDRAPPPFIGPRYTKVTADKAWELMERAQETGVSLRKTITIDSSKVSPALGDLWTLKYLQMYNESARLAFIRAAVNHVSIVADPATHSTKEACAVLAYSWEQNISAAPPIQIIQPGKVLTEQLPDHLSVLAAQRKLQRVSAYRQLQALENALFKLNGMSLDTFELPKGCNLAPVAANESRVMQNGVPFIYNKETKVALGTFPPARGHP